MAAVLWGATFGATLLAGGDCGTAAWTQAGVGSGAEGSATAGAPTKVLPSRTEVVRKAGVDTDSGIRYVLLSIAAQRLGAIGAQDVKGPEQDGALLETVSPLLTAQCTQTKSGKLKFELLAMLPPGGNASELAFYPPWRPMSDSDLFPPRLTRVQVTMEFLGYMKVKPVKRQWEILLENAGQMRYATPAMISANMEEIMFYLQYLKALPTLRLSIPGKAAASFETTAWQRAVREEPLCRASGL